MTIDQIIKLLDAGYTKDEIHAMEGTNNAPEQTPQPEPEPQQPDPEPTPEPAQNVRPESTINPQIEELSRSLKAFTAAIQKSNILASNMPTNPEPSAEDVLAEIINPTHKR